jgi:transposase-like protein
VIEVLKSCPFCGSDKVEADGWASTDTHGPACEDCGGSCGSALDAPEQNITAWNTRTTDQAKDEEIARLREALELAANRMQRLSLELPFSTAERYEAEDWAQEARRELKAPPNA